MSKIIVVRRFKSGDELQCRDMMKDAIMMSLNSAFIANLFKEVTFQSMILCAAIMFIFFGMPFTVCLFVIPLIIFVTYIATYIGFTIIAAEINQEIANVTRIYMSNAFSCFWVAEAFEPYLMTRDRKEIYYTLMSEKKFRESNINVTSQARNIVGTIGVLKSHKVETGAWIKRICVHRNYRRKGIASFLLSTAVQFAIDEGYSCADLVISEYSEGGRELCLKNGFELKQMYHRHIIGTMVSVLLYELTYQIKCENDYCIRD